MPVFAYLHWTQRPTAALAVFIAAGVSDSLDGFLARALDQRSDLGGVLDPVADKVLLAVALGSLAATGPVPGWFFCLVMLREAMLLAGAVVVHERGRSVPRVPSRLGKYATFLQLGAVLFALWVRLPGSSEVIREWFRVWVLLAAECVTVSAVHCAFLWSGLLVTHPGSRLDGGPR